MRDKKDILGFEKIGVKVSSAIGLKVTKKGSLQDNFMGTASTTSDGVGGTRHHEAMAGGAVLMFEPGETAETFSSDRPSPTFTGFLEYIDRDVAVGLGVPLEFVWDASKLGGTAQRFVLQLAQTKFEERQRLLARNAERVRNWVIAKGINRGDIRFHQDWWRVEWQFASKITVDVGREAQANREDYIAGLRTAKEDYAERGKSLREARRDSEQSARDLLKRAEKLVSEFSSHGLTLTHAIELIEKRGNSGSAPANQQNAQSQPAKTGGKTQ
jgi:capsid protein